MASVRIENLEEFRAVAAQHGVDTPAGRGRPSSRNLCIVLKAKGIEIVPTPYFDGSIHRQPVVKVAKQPKVAEPKSKAVYEVCARVPRRDTNGDVKLSKQGAVVHNPSLRKIQLTSEQIRELTGVARGKLSESKTVRAAAEFAGWLSGDELNDTAGLLKDVTVTAVDPDTIKPTDKPRSASKPRSAAKAAAKAEESAEAVDLDAVEETVAA